MEKPLQNDRYRQHFPPTLRERLKMSYIYWAHRLAGRVKTGPPSVQFFYGHFLFADELPSFHRWMDRLQTIFHIVSYSEAVRRVGEGDITGKHACFSFDDGFGNNLRLARLLAERGISAMFFVNPEVADRSSDGGWLAAHCRDRLHKQPLDFLSWQELESLKAMGHEIGNHSLRHERLSALPPAAWGEHIAAAREQLAARLGPVVHFAWPYGQRADMPPEAMRLALESGHQSLASGIRGRHFARLDLRRHFLLRDQLVFHEPLWVLDYFYRQSLRKRPDTEI